MELLTIKNGSVLLDPSASYSIAEYERAMKVLKFKEDELKEKIRAEMEAKGIVKVETDDLVINYIAPTERESFDSKSFRKEYPDIYDEFVKFTPVKSSIRLKVK